MERAIQSPIKAGAACALIGALLSATLESAVIDVNTVLDELADDGSCSLREAVISANTDAPSGVSAGECPAGSGADTIVLQAEVYNLTRPGASEDQARTGDLDIIDSLSIEGAGQDVTLIYGNDLDRIFHIRGVEKDFAVTISNLIISHGTFSGNGGGILSRKPLTLNSVSVYKNTAGGDGGGIYSAGSLMMSSCTVSDNIADDDGAGIFIAPGREASIEGSSIFGQVAGGTGGGVYSDGVLSINRTTIEFNQSVWGGGVHSLRDLVLTESTIGFNTVLRWGGGLANEGIASVTNSTISSNSAPEYGGNIANMSAGNLELLHATIADGVSPVGDAVHNDSSVIATNSIFLGSCAGFGLESIGGNVESPGNGCNLTRVRDRKNVPISKLDLYPLEDYGGPTFTNLLGRESIAIDLALPGVCPSNDQRGVVRPLDGDDDPRVRCDSGAVEIEPAFFEDDFESGDTSVWDEVRTP
jgi:CSLREA domain-containing protein